MIKLLWYLVSLALMFGASITRPQRARCPRGWWLAEGVRSSGEFACLRVPAGDTVRDARGIVRDPSAQPDGEIHSQVYCTGGRRAITVDGVEVGCQPGGWR